MTIKISSGQYGFGHNWTLEAHGRSFFLGQDVKFCLRVLGMDPSHVVKTIGTNRLDTEVGAKKLARFICKHLGITKKNIFTLEDWDLCAV